MVGLVVVSHSEALAEGVVALAREMGGEELALEAAGGMDEPGALGTDAERVRAAIERAMSDDGVLVLMDLGSALMSTEFAIEMLDGAGGRVLMSEAPLVEGTVAAAVAARGGASLEEVAAEARGALAMKASQLGVEDGAGPRAAEAEPAAPADARGAPEVRNAIGLHARPAARFVARRARLRRRGARGQGRRRRAGARDEPDQRRRARRALRRHAAGHRVGAAGDRGAGGAARAGRRGLRRRHRGGGGRAAAPRRPSPGARPPNVRRRRVGRRARGRPGLGRRRHRARAPPRRAAPARRPTARADDARARARAPRRGHRGRPRGDRTRPRGRRRRAPATPRRPSSTPTSPCSTTRRCSSPRTPRSRRGTTAERAWHDAAEQVAALYRGARRPAPARACGRRPRRRSPRRRRDHRRAARRPRRAGHRPRGRAHARRRRGPRPGARARDRHRPWLGHRARRRSSPARSACPPPSASATRVLAIDEGTPLLLDGDAGTLAGRPAARTCWPRRRGAPRARSPRAARPRASAPHEPGAMRDGARVEVFANLGSAAEAATAVELGAEGVGLLRTEFLFLDRAQLPDEDEQAETLRQIAVALDGRPLVVRTLDAGADKPLPALPHAARGQPVPRRARHPPGARSARRSSPRSCARSCAWRPSTRSRRCCRWSPRSAEVQRRRARCSTRRGPPPASTRRSSSGSWSRSPPPR